MAIPRDTADGLSLRHVLMVVLARNAPPETENDCRELARVIELNKTVMTSIHIAFIFRDIIMLFAVADDPFDG